MPRKAHQTRIRPAARQVARPTPRLPFELIGIIITCLVPMLTRDQAARLLSVSPEVAHFTREVLYADLYVGARRTGPPFQWAHDVFGRGLSASRVVRTLTLCGCVTDAHHVRFFHRNVSTPAILGLLALFPRCHALTIADFTAHMTAGARRRLPVSAGHSVTTLTLQNLDATHIIQALRSILPALPALRHLSADQPPGGRQPWPEPTSEVITDAPAQLTTLSLPNCTFTAPALSQLMLDTTSATLRTLCLAVTPTFWVFFPVHPPESLRLSGLTALHTLRVRVPLAACKLLPHLYSVTLSVVGIIQRSPRTLRSLELEFDYSGISTATGDGFVLEFPFDLLAAALQERTRPVQAVVSLTRDETIPALDARVLSWARLFECRPAWMADAIADSSPLSFQT